MQRPRVQAAPSTTTAASTTAASTPLTHQPRPRIVTLRDLQDCGVDLALDPFGGTPSLDFTTCTINPDIRENVTMTSAQPAVEQRLPLSDILRPAAIALGNKVMPAQPPPATAATAPPAAVVKTCRLTAVKSSAAAPAKPPAAAVPPAAKPPAAVKPPAAKSTEARVAAASGSSSAPPPPTAVLEIAVPPAEQLVDGMPGPNKASGCTKPGVTWDIAWDAPSRRPYRTQITPTANKIPQFGVVVTSPLRKPWENVLATFGDTDTFEVPGITIDDYEHLRKNVPLPKCEVPPAMCCEHMRDLMHGAVGLPLISPCGSMHILLHHSLLDDVV